MNAEYYHAMQKAAEYQQKADLYKSIAESIKADSFKFNSIEDMLRKLADVKDKIPDAKPKSLTLEEIDDELDIIRGVKPTPAGYKVDTSRMKDLLKKRAEMDK